ncbi:MAG: MBL fold metallo-hydrolase [Candidatus Sericytochromatia bacterium]
MKFRFLKACHGDCILISFEDKEKVKRNILIDGGTSKTYRFKNNKGKFEDGVLKNLIDELNQKNEKIDILILTHDDSDHIGGLISWFENKNFDPNLIGELWFNSSKNVAEFFSESENIDNIKELNLETDSTNTSTKQRIKFEYFIENKNISNRKIVKSCDKFNDFEFGVEFKILSPKENKLQKMLDKYEKEKTNTNTSSKPNDYNSTLKEHIDKDEDNIDKVKSKFKEDATVPNGSSISFILTFNEKNYLFLADSHPSDIIESLINFGYSETSPLKADFVKVSHHGSSFNTNYELLKLIDSNNFVILTNGDIHQLPDKKCLARIINFNQIKNRNTNLFFNYIERSKRIFKENDKNDFSFSILDSDTINN